MVSAPHLPPKSCDIEMHKRLQALPVFLLVLFIALLSGATASLATLAWIAPPALSNQFFPIVGSNGRSLAETPVDPAIMNQTKQRQIVIYDSAKKIAQTLYPDEALVATGVLLSSDGWAVAHYPNYRLGREKQWEGVDVQGIMHPIERALFDPSTGLVYVKFQGEGFRIQPFAPWDAIRPDTVVFALPPSTVDASLDWKPVSIGRAERTTADLAYPITRAEYLARLNGETSLGDVILTSQGELIGFADASAHLIPGWVVEAHLSSLLSGGTLATRSLSFEGQVVRGILVDGVLKPLVGFHVTKPVRRTENTIGKGDVIIRLGSHPFDPSTALRSILFAGPELSVTIIRDGAEKEILIKKTILP